MVLVEMRMQRLMSDNTLFTLKDRMNNNTLKNRIIYECIRGKMEVGSIEDKTIEISHECFGRVQHRPTDALVKRREREKN